MYLRTYACMHLSIYLSNLINPCNAYNINQDSGAWVLILEGFWVLKLVFEWCRIHIKTVLAQHYSLVVFYPILLWFTYALFIQATPVQVGPGPPKSAQGNPNLQVLPGSPRSSQENSDFLRFCGFSGFPGRTWVLFSAFLWVSGISWENLGVIFCVFVGFRISWENLGVIFCVFLGFRDFLGEPGCYFLRFCGFPGFPGRTWVLFSALLWGFRDFLGEPGCYFLRFCGVSGISWENLGGNSWGWAWESCKS